MALKFHLKLFQNLENRIFLDQSNEMCLKLYQFIDGIFTATPLIMSFCDEIIVPLESLLQSMMNTKVDILMATGSVFSMIVVICLLHRNKLLLPDISDKQDQLNLLNVLIPKFFSYAKIGLS